MFGFIFGGLLAKITTIMTCFTVLMGVGKITNAMIKVANDPESMESVMEGIEGLKSLGEDKGLEEQIDEILDEVEEIEAETEEAQAEEAQEVVEEPEEISDTAEEDAEAAKKEEEDKKAAEEAKKAAEEKAKEEEKAAQEAAKALEEANKAAEAAASQAQKAVENAAGGKVEVSRQYYEDCGSDTGYWEIVYSDGSVEYIDD